MRALYIDDSVRSAVNKVVDYANLNILTIDDMLDIMNGQKIPPGDIKEHCIIIFDGYGCIFSIEEQNQGRVRHLSVHLTNAKDPGLFLPSPEAVRAIAMLFGIKCIEDCHVSIESDIKNVRNFINIVEYQ